MKEKILTFAAALFVFLPWTIFPLRTHSWALVSPIAEITIICYIAVMILGGIFTSLCYAKGKIQNKLMQICMVINDIFAFGGIVLAGWMIYSSLI